jgi:hypothetical protein
MTMPVYTYFNKIGELGSLLVPKVVDWDRERCGPFNEGRSTMGLKSVLS